MLQNCRISGFADEIDEQFDKQLEVIRDLQMPAIELRKADGINVSDFTGEKAREVKCKLDAAGIIVSAIGSPIGKISISEDFTPHFEKFKHTVEIAKLMDCANIRMFSFFMPEGADPAVYRDEVLRRMDQMVNWAINHDAILLHENEKGIYGSTTACCMDLMGHFAGDHFKAVFDFANFVQCQQDTNEAYELLRPYIAYVHIKDAHAADKLVVPAGMGEGHVAALLKRLDDSGYCGWLSLEPHLEKFAELRAEQSGSEKLTGAQTFAMAHQALMDILGTN